MLTAEVIAPAPPLAIAPNIATPIAPAACRVVLRTAEAVPLRVFSTQERMPVVIAGTATPMPRGMMIKGMNSFQ